MSNERQLAAALADLLTLQHNIPTKCGDDNCLVCPANRRIIFNARQLLHDVKIPTQAEEIAATQRQDSLLQNVAAIGWQLGIETMQHPEIWGPDDRILWPDQMAFVQRLATELTQLESESDDLYANVSWYDVVDRICDLVKDDMGREDWKGAILSMIQSEEADETGGQS